MMRKPYSFTRLTPLLACQVSGFLSWSPDLLGCKLATAVTLEVEGGGPCEPDEKCEDRLEGQAQGQGN